MTLSDAVQGWVESVVSEVVRSERMEVHVRDYASVQDAINYVESLQGEFVLILDAGVHRCTAPLVITKPIHIKGHGSSWAGVAGTITDASFHGSWLYFDHAGVGVSVNSTVYFSDIRFSGFGTVRNQPAPALGWAPNNHDYDFKITSTSDVYFEHMLLLNPTKGIQLLNSNAGRLFVDHLKGHAFQVGINVDIAYDVCYFNTVHFWPFWADNDFVHAYTLINLSGFLLGRCDNPHFSSIFTIFARSGICAYQNAYGAASKLHVVNADFDRGAIGLLVQSSVTNGITGQFVNMTHQGEDGLAGSKGIVVNGNNSTLDITNFSSALSNQNAVRLEGTGNTINFSGHTRCLNYDQSAVGFPAIEALLGNAVRIDGTPTISGANKYGGAGLIYVEEWRSYTPTVTSGTGAIATLGAVTGKYKRTCNTISIVVTVVITTNGTAAGSVNVSLPQAAANSTRIISGRESMMVGKMLQGLIVAGSSTCIIYNYDNSYPGGSGAVLIINGDYEI